MSAYVGRPEWQAREVAARFAIGFAGGAIAVMATDPALTRALGERPFLVGRILFVAAASIVAAVLSRAWYRVVLRAALVAAVPAASLTLVAGPVLFVLLTALVKPVGDDVWESLFVNANTTFAYAPVYGLVMAILFIVAVPASRAILGLAFGGSPGMAVRRQPGPTSRSDRKA
jgi:hypothetical protein